MADDELLGLVRAGRFAETGSAGMCLGEISYAHASFTFCLYAWSQDKNLFNPQ